MPGRKEHNGANMIDAAADLMNSFFVRNISFIGEIICLGREVFDFNEKRRFERPNKPERRGRRGSFVGRWNVKIPRMPARVKIRAAKNDFSSLKIM